MARITATGKRHIYLQRLHDRYGDVVRVGELFGLLQMFNAEATRSSQRDIHSRRRRDHTAVWSGRVAKGPWSVRHRPEFDAMLNVVQA